MAYNPSQKNSKAKPRQSTGKTILKVVLGVFVFIFRVIIIFGCIGVIIGSMLAVAVSLYVVEVTAEDEQKLDLGSIKLSYTTILYATSPETGESIEYVRLVGDENRIWVNYDEISEPMLQAIVAVEDDSYWEHNGVNYVRTFAAFLDEYTPLKVLGGTGQGASTLTQQLVKNLTEDNSVDAMRKIREIFRAIALENRYSKEVIIEAYLNTFRLSDNIAGVETAANIYFGKSASHLTITEAAMIAGITQSPVAYDPYDNPEACLDRRNTVLYHMNRVGYIDEDEYNFAVDQPLGLVTTVAPTTTEIVVENEDGTLVDSTETSEEDQIEAAADESDVTVTVDNEGNIIRTKQVYSWYTDMVIESVITDFVEQQDMTRDEASNLVYNGGLRIYLPIDLNLQSAMDEVMMDEEYYRQFFPEIIDEKVDFFGDLILDDNGEVIMVEPQAAMVSVNMKGEIAAVVGGLGEKEEDRLHNRAVDSVRQTGSTMKPIGSYTPALDYNFITYSTMVRDAPMPASPATGNQPWPRNYNRSYTEQNMSIETAISRSINTVAVHVLDLIGLQTSFSFLTDTLQISTLYEQVDIDGQIYTDVGLAPLALGAMTEGISPMEMAASYSIFGNGGKFTTPHCYTSIEDYNGELVMEPDITQAIKPDTAHIMNELLSTVLYQGGGTGYGLYADYMPSVGKTGTTSDDRDHWFIGVTPYYSTATWWGYDDPQELQWTTYSKHPPTWAWREVMNIAQENMEVIDFPVSENVVELRFCTSSGLLAASGCPSDVGYYKRDNPPPLCSYTHVPEDPAAAPAA